MATAPLAPSLVAPPLVQKPYVAPAPVAQVVHVAPVDPVAHVDQVAPAAHVAPFPVAPSPVHQAPFIPPPVVKTEAEVGLEEPVQAKQAPLDLKQEKEAGQETAVTIKFFYYF